MNQLALKLIKKEKQEQTGILDLGNCGLADFPKELFELYWLTELNICQRYPDRENNKYVESDNQGPENNIQVAQLPEAFKAFNQLKTLRIEGTYERSSQIEDCSILQRLPSLTSLYLCNNKISNIKALGGISGLTELDLSYNNIEDIDTLGTLTNLASLYLVGNKINNINALSTLIGLNTLDLSYNQISNIGALKKLNRLCSLCLDNNKIADIDALSTLTNLTSLEIADNLITEVGSLGSLTGLVSLGLDGNQISNIDALGALANLTELDLCNNQICDIGALNTLTNLNTLDLSCNQITNIKGLVPLLKNNTGLNMEEDEEDEKYLSLYGNPIDQPPMNIVEQGKETILAYFG